MRLYTEAPYADMQMRYDPLQHQLLVNLIKEREITVCTETGTYLGLGSTTNLANAFLEAYGDSTHEWVRLITMEANKENYEKACNNLAKYPFVFPVFGSSLDPADIEKAIMSDEMLINYDAPEYANVYCDGHGDMRQNYIAESLGSNGPHSKLIECLEEYKDEDPLIVLDSAGGLGKLEFDTMLRVMGNKDYSLLLDDIEHVKHVRSLKYIQAHPEQFTLLGTQNGWALATHHGN